MPLLIISKQPPLIEEVLFQSIEEELKLFTKTIEKENGNTIIFNFQSLPDRAKTDRETIELILTNLISNSAKHAYKSGILGEIRVKAHIQFPNWLVFIVEDDGFGIEKSEIKHIFEPFYRGNKSFQDQIKGSGLGLYLSFRKAILLGGTLKVESPYERVDEKIRKGSRFTLKIPYVLANEESRL
jgi:signal transduction histidine kinase